MTNSNNKIVIYQLFTRLFGNSNLTCKQNGTIAENGCGKLKDLDDAVLRHIRGMGISHIWPTGVIRHATQTLYTSSGIPAQHPAVVKGKAGSPYAITDYYDIDPDLAEVPERRMEEFEAFLERAHKAGLKVIIDFVPNHVAREYKSICKPIGVKDLGEDDDVTQAFSSQNNFYYIPGEEFQPTFDKGTYTEYPAKATGNDRFDAHPGVNDWYETVKLNYGVDYLSHRSEHFFPIPDTWQKMTDILLFWMEKGVDAFRCDMAEMVPEAFWNHAIRTVKHRKTEVLFIGEVYDPSRYRAYLAAGFDYLYDKVGMYDTLRAVMRAERPATDITLRWQDTGDIYNRMLYFLENHDEQRVASDFFCGDARMGIPAVGVALLMLRNPFMLYAGQEYGERGMDSEGFSGCDGRTTIFDYWALDTLQKGFRTPEHLTDSQRELYTAYTRIIQIAVQEPAVGNGDFFDLMYANPFTASFNPHRQYAFLRRYKNDMLLVAANFASEQVVVEVNLPDHAFDFFQMTPGKRKLHNLLTGHEEERMIAPGVPVSLSIAGYGVTILKCKIAMEEQDYLLNEHHKEEFPPAHTAEHLLNQVMVRRFGCERSKNAHIERKKSKMTFILDRKPDRKDEKAIEREMNELIAADLPVTYELVDRAHIPEGVSLERLPDNASEMLRIVRIGDFDVCACIGKHVRSTSQIGRFELLGTNWDQEKHSFRIRFKVVQ